MASLSGTLRSMGRYAEAEKLAQETLDAGRRVLGHEHPPTPLHRHTTLLAQSRDRDGHDEAFSLPQEAVDHGLRSSDDLSIEKDAELQSLHADARFALVTSSSRNRVGVLFLRLFEAQ